VISVAENNSNQELTSAAYLEIKVEITEDARDYILKDNQAITVEVETSYV